MLIVFFTQGISFEDIINRVMPPVPGSSSFDEYRIMVQVRPTVPVSHKIPFFIMISDLSSLQLVRTTPMRTFEENYDSESPPSSVPSLSSSGTMASDDTAPLPPLARPIDVGDLLAIQRTSNETFLGDLKLAMIPLYVFVVFSSTSFVINAPLRSGPSIENMILHLRGH